MNRRKPQGRKAVIAALLRLASTLVLEEERDWGEVWHELDKLHAETFRYWKKQEETR